MKCRHLLQHTHARMHINTLHTHTTHTRHIYTLHTHTTCTRTRATLALLRWQQQSYPFLESAVERMLIISHTRGGEESRRDRRQGGSTCEGWIPWLDSHVTHVVGGPGASWRRVLSKPHRSARSAAGRYLHPPSHPPITHPVTRQIIKANTTRSGNNADPPSSGD